ncbi:hypothetical protein CRUP_034308, partial [Coryphaenoides rupestris]
VRVMESHRRRMVVDVRLDNKGENAYGARLNISHTHNLRFSSLVVKLSPSCSKWPLSSVQDNADVPVECEGDGRLKDAKLCNVSAPFMRAKTQVRPPYLPTSHTRHLPHPHAMSAIYIFLVHLVHHLLRNAIMRRKRRRDVKNIYLVLLVKRLSWCCDG